MAKRLKHTLSIVLISAFMASTATADITEGLVGHWPLIDGAGTVAADKAGRGNDGAIEGDAA